METIGGNEEAVARRKTVIPLAYESLLEDSARRPASRYVRKIFDVSRLARRGSGQEKRRATNINGIRQAESVTWRESERE